VTEVADNGEETAVRRNGRITRVAGYVLLAFGLVLLMGVGAFYGYGFYSSTQLGKLNASIQGPITLPDSTILHGALLPDGGFAPINSLITDPDEIAKFQPISRTDVAETASLNTSEEAPFPVARFAEIYPGYQLHPKYWGQPLWAGTDQYVHQEIVRPDGFRAVSVSDPIYQGKKLNPKRIRIPSIGLNSVISDLAIQDLGDSRQYETPKNVVGHIPDTWDSGKDKNGWFFGHLESPIKGEGSVFHRLPDISNKLRDGDPVYISIVNFDAEYLYQVVSSEVIHEDQLSLYDTDDSTITLVTCANRPFYDQRQLVTAKLVGVRPIS